jgi:hypothetical protein
MPRRKGARVAVLDLAWLYMRIPISVVRCGFHDLSSNLTVGRRNAYLSSSTHLPGGDIRRSSSGFGIRRSQDIYTTEAELAVELGWVVYPRICAQS